MSDAACPCRCCGDMPHLDVSAWAFEKLADKKWGVIGLKFRRVPCTYTPGSPAAPVANPSAGVGVESGGQHAQHEACVCTQAPQA